MKGNKAMSKARSTKEQRKKRKSNKNLAARVCSILGTVLLIILVIVCVPLTLPRMAGIDIYTVVSGSMEPAIPTGSLVYVKNINPEDVKEDEVIAF